MKLFSRIIAFVAAVPFPATAAPVDKASATIPGKYIVLFKPDTDAAAIEAHYVKVKMVHSANVARRSISGPESKGVENQYSFGGFKGYSGGFDAVTIEALKSMSEIKNIEQDSVMTTLALVEQQNATWGLGSISSRTNGATSYIYDDTAGAGTYSYIIDTGIRTTHQEFGGRATIGYNAVNSVMADDAGHGTHVAGTIGGITYGVAKKTTLIGVKVFEGNSGQTSTVIKGFDWAVNDIVTNNRTSLAVINLSLGGPGSTTWDDAMTAAYSEGILCTVAAGNDNLPASEMSPARSPEPITVGNVQPNDARYGGSQGSNYGPATDIYAAGTDVRSAYRTSDNATQLLSGTSMASPHVAGLVSYLRGLSLGDGGISAEEVKQTVLDLATTGRVTDLMDSADRLAYNGNGR